MNTRSIMIQGTSSDAGKSTLVTALCRVLYRKGIRVAPFKPQNMALNSVVTKDGGEIGRSQAVQAYASGLEPLIDMNPILLKPTTDKTAQVIIHGHPIGDQDAKNYHDYKKVAINAALTSYHRLSAQFDIIVIEGAGSPAEINLRKNDIANMGFAEAIDCPVILIADIDRGGVFAQIVGTLELLSDSERQRIVGFVINRFRGDIALLQDGLDWLEQKTNKPVLGVLPYLSGFHLEAEDAINTGQATSTNAFRVVVLVLPRISNHTDFDPLRLHPEIDLQFIGPGQELPPADLIILPGSKSVISDLNWLIDQQWDKAIARHLRYGGKLLGICGGYQMLGQEILDPMRIEGEMTQCAGLGYLDIQTSIESRKQLHNVSGILSFSGARVDGYEIHAGITQGPGLSRPMVELVHGVDGAISSDDQVMGCYLHGLFENPEAFSSIMAWAGMKQKTVYDYRARREADINRLADCIEDNLNIEKIIERLDIKLPEQAHAKPHTETTL